MQSQREIYLETWSVLDKKQTDSSDSDDKKPADSVGIVFGKTRSGAGIVFGPVSELYLDEKDQTYYEAPCGQRKKILEIADDAEKPEREANKCY